MPNTKFNVRQEFAGYMVAMTVQGPKATAVALAGLIAIEDKAKELHNA